MNVHPSILLALLITSGTAPTLIAAAQDTDATPPRVGVLCVVSTTSAFPFAAGNDRCFREINGRTVPPQHAAACLMQGADYTRVTFVFSAIPAFECGGPAAYGVKAEKSRIEAALSALAPHEREFFLSHLPPEA